MNKLIECQFFRDRIPHFQADEVPEDERQRLQRHLDHCDDCSARLAYEESMLRGIVRRLRPSPAPPGLETRIRASLASASPARSVGGWYRRPWFAAVAASLLLAVLVLAGNADSPYQSASGGAVQVARQQVTVVDRDCERAGRTLTQQRNCRNHNHLNVLRVSNGEYWFVSLDHNAGKRILLDPDMRGQHLVVAGDLYPKIRTLRLTDYRTVDTVGTVGTGDRGLSAPVSL